MSLSRTHSRAMGLPALLALVAFLLACGSGVTGFYEVEPASGEADLPRWVDESNLVSVTDWSDDVISGSGDVRYEITGRLGIDHGPLIVRYTVVGSTTSAPEHLLATTGGVGLPPIETVVTRRADDSVEKGEWHFPGAAQSYNLFDDASFRLYE